VCFSTNEKCQIKLVCLLLGSGDTTEKINKSAFTKFDQRLLSNQRRISTILSLCASPLVNRDPLNKPSAGGGGGGGGGAGTPIDAGGSIGGGGGGEGGRCSTGILTPKLEDEFVSGTGGGGGRSASALLTVGGKK
jgi:hypothetical protein